jgi:hypothetical protein
MPLQWEGTGGVVSPLPGAAVDFEADNAAFSGLANGDPFLVWPDESGNVNNATAPASGNRATYRTADGPGGRPCVRFNAIAFYNLASSIANGPYTLMALIKPISGAPRTIFGGTSGSFQWRINPLKSNAVKEAVLDLGSSTTNLSTSAFQQVSITSNAAGVGNFRLGSVADGSYSSATTFTQGLSHLGTEGSGLERFNGDMCAAMAWTSVLSLAQIQTQEGLWLVRWGVN